MSGAGVEAAPADRPDIFAVMDATWPAAALRQAGPWWVREGRGGGKRVSAATATDAEAAVAEIPAMEAAQAALGQPPLAMVRGDQPALDAALAARDYRVIDPVVAYLSPLAPLTGEIPPVAAIPVWPPLAIQAEVWAEGGIGPGRLQVMARAAAPRTTLIARLDDRVAGCAFVSIHDGAAMLHALEVAPVWRRRGAGRILMRAAANWAAEAGAGWFSLVVTEGNAGARALYASLGMAVVERYHYRMK